MLVTTKKGRRPKAQVPPPAAANINLTDDRLVATAEAARLLGLSQKCLREWRCDRTGPAALKMGSGQRARVFYRLSSLEAWCRTNLTTLDEARVERAEKAAEGMTPRQRAVYGLPPLSPAADLLQARKAVL